MILLITPELYSKVKTAANSSDQIFFKFLYIHFLPLSMVLPIIFAIIGIAGGAYGLYEHFNKPKCPKCGARLKIKDNVCSCGKCDYQTKID